MKKIILAAVTLAIGSAAYAQTTTPSTSTASSTSTTKFGIKAGVNLPSYKLTSAADKEVDTESTINFHVTGFADIALGTSFSFQPALSLQGKGAKFFDTKQVNAKDVEVKQNTLAVEIPLNFVGKLPAGPGYLYLGAGPYISANIAGQDKVESNGQNTDTDLKFGDEVGDNLKTTDIGVNVLGGYQFNSGLMLGGGYGYGIRNLAPQGSGYKEINNRVWSFSVGFAF